MTTARLLPEEMLLRDRRPWRSQVAIISAEEYSERLDHVLLSALRAFRLNLRGKSVLLKPNFVEYIAGVEVNTNPLLVGAAAEAFLKLGAKSVVVGEARVIAGVEPGAVLSVGFVVRRREHADHGGLRRLAFAMTPGWLYLPMARATGELAEYMAKSRDRQPGCAVFTETESTQLESADPASWLEGLQSYTKRWVEEHHAGGADTWTVVANNAA